jgi:D-alanyl-D-alanine carboxypeptidase
MDASTGRVLYDYNGGKQSLIASTTKIMTGLLIAESCDLEAEVAVPDEALLVEGSSMYLKQGEILTVEALLYGLMLHSGNDAAIALAMYDSGSVEAFVHKMNKKAYELSLVNTHFENPHGLDSENHYSTAYDLAKLTAYALDNPVFNQVVSTKTISIGERTLTNHNRLLRQYDGAIGVKTGYTRAAGRILVSAAERQGRRLICVTIHDPNDWKDHTALLDYGFEHYQVKTIADSGRVMGSVPVLCGSEPAQAVLRDGIQIPLSDREQIEVIIHLPPLVFAPVFAGEPAGKVEVLIDGVYFREYPLYWRFSVLEAK